MVDVISSAVERTLSSKPLMLAHPSSSALSDLYSSVSSSTSHLVETVNRCGAIRVTSNNLSLGATSNYSVSSSLLLYNPVLHLAFSLPANNIVMDGWGLQAIQSIELSFANSLAQNMLISGTALRDVLLFHQSDPEKRKIVLQQCGRANVGAVTVQCAIPLACLINRAQISNTFPLDMSTLNGFLQLNITFNTAQKFIFDIQSNTTPPVTTAWTSNYLTFCSSAINDAGFGIKQALLNDPMAVYSIPNTWIAPYRYNKSIQANAGATTELSVTSAPKGMLQGFLMTVTPSSELAGTADGRTISYPSGVDLSALRVQYNGIDIFRADTPYEIDSYYRYKFDGDNLSFNYLFFRARTPGTAANNDLMEAKVYFVPFDYHSGLVRSQTHVENLPSYDGATIQISFVVNTVNRTYYLPATPWTPASLATAGAAAAEDYTIEITWLLASLVEISESGVDIQR